MSDNARDIFASIYHEETLYKNQVENYICTCNLLTVQSCFRIEDYLKSSASSISCPVLTSLRNDQKHMMRCITITFCIRRTRQAFVSFKQHKGERFVEEMPFHTGVDLSARHLQITSKIADWRFDILTSLAIFM